MLYLAQLHRSTDEAASAYKNMRKRTRAHLEHIVEDNTALTEQLRQTKDEVGRLERVCEGLRDELDGQQERVREAGALEEQNSKLAHSILGLRKDLANAEKAFKELHDEMTTVTENHAKRLRLLLG